MVTLALALYRRDFERNFGLMLRGWGMFLRSPKRAVGYFQAIAVLIAQELEGQAPETLKPKPVLDGWGDRRQFLQKSLRRALRPVLLVYVLWVVVSLMPFFLLPSLIQSPQFEETTGFWLLLGAIALLLVLAFALFMAFVIWVQLRATFILPLVVFLEEHETPRLVVQRCRSLTQGHARRLVGMNFLSNVVIWPLRLLPLLAYWAMLRVGELAASWAFLTYAAIAVAVILNSMVMTPFRQILQAIVYHDLLIRQDGLDLRLRSPQRP